ncbi:MAG: High-affinity zinc uptake system binding-protein ZnuA [Firmicutes bacterium]|nr:High-affinity zinc uptake system binding-protein ZnuA [candidate division NPL-UPA2 bacterium]MBT9154279.1 High-affinity zinc uptake system binding-protein ZnuA [candidate division NPL-UPA2 bacterium]
MKRFLVVSLVLVLSLSLSGCAALQTRLAGTGRPTVITTLFPQYDFVRAIAGDKVQVSLLLPPGVESHAFEPTPRDIANIHRADVFIYTSKYMEPWAPRVIEALQGRPVVVVDASHGIELEAQEKHEDPYEWVGAFDLVPGYYQLVFSRVDGKYADPTMPIVFMQSAYSKQDALDAAKLDAKSLFEQATPALLQHGGSISPRAGIYTLEFDQNRNDSIFSIRIETAGTYVLVTGHLPSEFEAGRHFFRDAQDRDVVSVVEYPDHKDGDPDHKHAHGKDPHIWLDPVFAKQMVDNIVAGLAQADPNNAAFYRQNGDAYKAKLQALHEQFASFLATIENRTILYAGHFAFGHFARRYSLEHKSPYVGFSPTAEPTPRRIAELIENVRKTGSQVIYHEALVEPRVARIISEATGARMLLLHGAHNVSRDDLRGGATYLSIMEGNLARLREGLR